MDTDSPATCKNIYKLSSLKKIIFILFSEHISCQGLLKDIKPLDIRILLHFNLHHFCTTIGIKRLWDYYFFSIRLLSVLRGHSFLHPHHNGQWLPTSKDFYTWSYQLHYFLILILEKEPVFPFSMFSAKQGNYRYNFYNVFGMTRSLSGDWTRDLPH